MRGAIADLLRCGLVAGRSAADDGADPELAQLEAVVATNGDGLAGEAKLVEHRVHEVAGAVAGEGAAGAVGSVGTGSEAEHEDAGVGVAEAGNGFGPVFLVAVGLAARLANAADVVDKPRTARAGDDVFLHLIEDG